MTAPRNGSSPAAQAGKACNGHQNGYNTRSRASGKASSNDESIGNGGLANGHDSSCNSSAINGHANGHANGTSHKGENGHTKLEKPQQQQQQQQQQNGTADSRPTNGSKADHQPDKAPPKPDTRPGDYGPALCKSALLALRSVLLVTVAAAHSTVPLQHRQLILPTSLCTCSHAEFPSETLAHRLRMTGRTLQVVLALVLMKAMHSGSAYLQVHGATNFEFVMASPTVLSQPPASPSE
jgi:hypothetical protein